MSMYPDAIKTAILDLITNASGRHLALFTTRPADESGAGGVEVSAGWYSRQALDAADWSDDAPTLEGAIVRRNDDPITFGTVTGADVTITGWGIYDASSGGNLKAFGRVIGPEGGESGATIPVTQSVEIAANGIALVVGDSATVLVNVPGSGIVTISAIIVANYTASVAELVRYDASAAPYTIFAPPSPSLGDEWAIAEVGVSSGSVTIDGNGSNIVAPSTLSVSSFVTTAPSAALRWFYDGSVWRALT